MFRRWHVLFITLILTPCAVANWPGQPQGANYAFLVGCSNYEKAEFHQLPYTGNDVLGFRAALKTTSFSDDHMVVLHDQTKEPNRYLPTKAKILHELDLLLAAMKKNDTLVVALSGHGLQFKGDPVSYFVPVDGKVADKTTLIPLDGKDGLYERISKCNAARKLLIVNACRNDPAANVDFAAKKVELVDEDRKEEVPQGIAAIYSCQQGQMSYYDTDRKMAIFFDHVIRAWKGEYTKDGKVTLDKFFLQVEDMTATDARKIFGRPQVPLVMRDFKGTWEIGAAKTADNEGRVYFKEAGFSMMPPKGWTKGQSVGNTFLSYTGPSSENNPNLNVRIGDYDDTPLEKFALQIKEAMPKIPGFKAWKLLDEHHLMIDGKKAYTFSAQATVNVNGQNLEIKSLQYCIVGDNRKMYTVTFTGVPMVFDRQRKTYEQSALTSRTD